MRTQSRDDLNSGQYSVCYADDLNLRCTNANLHGGDINNRQQWGSNTKRVLISDGRWRSICGPYHSKLEHYARSFYISFI